VTTVTDGGLATELETRGHDLSDRLWSARILLTEPDAIEDVHLAYFRAGAQVATTASYQATVEGFAAAGLDRATALAAIARSVELARRARDRFVAEMAETADAAETTLVPEPSGRGRDPSGLLVAGSVGPYGAMLADGSEYRGDNDPGPAALRDLHAPRIDALLEAGVDLLAIETIPTTREAAVLLDLVEETGARAWLSYQCRDGTTIAAGDPFVEAVRQADGRAGVVAVGVNCTAPRHVPALLAAAVGVTALPLVAYPNSGDTWDPTARHWLAGDADVAFDAGVVADWTDRGAAWLGGCCGTGPADIRALANALATRAA
jgi:homocysteine S-methyltransferase